MNLYITFLALAFMICFLVSGFYWHVVHVTASTALKFRLLARRDHLRRLAITGDEDASSFAYQEVESFICKTIRIVPSISLVSFMWFLFCNSRNTAETDSEKRFRKEASKELKSIVHATARDALRFMMLNSPILFTIAAIISIVMGLFGGFNKANVYHNAETFVDALPQRA